MVRLNSEAAKFLARRYKTDASSCLTVGKYDMPALAPVEDFTPPSD